MKYEILACLFCLLVVTENAHAWCRFSGVEPGQKLKKCQCDSTPLKEIKNAEKAEFEIHISDEVKDTDGQVISLKMEEVIPKSWLYEASGIYTSYWFRTKQACIEERQKASQVKAQKESKLKEEKSPYE